MLTPEACWYQNAGWHQDFAYTRSWLAPEVGWHQDFADTRSWLAPETLLTQEGWHQNFANADAGGPAPGTLLTQEGWHQGLCRYQKNADTRGLFAGIRSSLRLLRNFLPLPAFPPWHLSCRVAIFSSRHRTIYEMLDFTTYYERMKVRQKAGCTRRSRRKQTSKWVRESAFRAHLSVQEEFPICVCVWHTLC